MNKENINKLYRLNVELEGILRVLEERDTPAARQLLNEKYGLYHSAMQQLLSDCASAAEGVGEPTVAETLDQGATELLEQAHHVEVKDQEAVENEVESEMDAAVAAVERGQQEAAAEQVEQQVAEQPEASKMKVDEMIQRRESADLRRVFTLNDKFRFRRELFGNDERAFAEAIDALDQMQTYGQAEAYLFGKLQLDETDEAVRDFVTVIQRHFGV